MISYPIPVGRCSEPEGHSWEERFPWSTQCRNCNASIHLEYNAETQVATVTIIGAADNLSTVAA